MKISHNRLLPMAMLLALTPIALASTQWYVNGVSGSDSNDCMSAQSACQTIGHAISLASSGDSVTVAAAIYKENLTIKVGLSITGAGAGKTIIDGANLNTVVNIPNKATVVTISRVTIRHGSAQEGAGISNWGTLTVNSSAITQNGSTSNVSGGGIFNYGTLTVNTSTLCRNGSVQNGAGITNVGTLTVSNSNFSENAASKLGGGILNYAGGTAWISNSTFAANTASLGGAVNNVSGTMWISNSTFSGNTATADGGGIFNSYSTSLTISSSTLNGNSAGHGGGIFNDGGNATLQNSIVANSISGGNCSVGVTSNGYNLSSDGTCKFGNSGDMNSTDPMVGPLQQNGGATMTIALPAGSPALDAGNPSGCTDGQGNLLMTDQRGEPRPGPKDHSGCDIGSYESQID